MTGNLVSKRNPSIRHTSLIDLLQASSNVGVHLNFENAPRNFPPVLQLTDTRQLGHRTVQNQTISIVVFETPTMF